MGFRFRKSITLIPGVRLNMGKKGTSLSIGGHGLTKTFHSDGKVTTTVSVPGTGISYVDVQKPKKTPTPTNHTQKSSKKTLPQSPAASNPTSTSKPSLSTKASALNLVSNASSSPTAAKPANTPHLPDADFLRCIHKTSDDTIEWNEIALNPGPPESFYDRNLWNFLHSVAGLILAGDIDAYLDVIGRMEPVDDLLAYGNQFMFGTDNPKRMHVEFILNCTILDDAAATMPKEAYNDLVQDYVCSVCIRIARDTFALLPIEKVFVHAVVNNETVVSVVFERQQFMSVKFAYADPSQLLQSFPHRMSFSKKKGLSPVVRII